MFAAWPRLVYHRFELLRTITTCWLRIEECETKAEGLDEIQRTIEKTAQILTIALEGEVEIITEYQNLVNADPRLERLLGQAGEI